MFGYMTEIDTVDMMDEQIIEAEGLYPRMLYHRILYLRISYTNSYLA